jgi:hypothetical protein
MLKHVGKMKTNGAKVAVVYRTLPGDPYNALVIGTGTLGDAYHDSLMNLIQGPEAQQAYELAEILAVRSFQDGSNMLQWLHSRNHLKKVPTDSVLMTPAPQSAIPLNELNELIAKDKNVSVHELALTDDTKKVAANVDLKSSEVVEVKIEEEKPQSATDLRSKADALFKEAQALRRKADEMDPPKKKTKKTNC